MIQKAFWTNIAKPQTCHHGFEGCALRHHLMTFGKKLGKNTNVFS